MGSRQAKEIKKQAMKEVGVEMNARLDKIEAYCNSSLAKAEARAKAIEGFLMKVVKVEIQNDLYNANITVDAVVAVLAESGLAIPEFAAKVDAKKKELDASKKAAASAQMQAEMEARAAQGKPADVIGLADSAPAPAETSPQ